MENFIKGEYGAIETKEEVYFSCEEGNRVALAEFATTLPEEREQLTRNKGKWFMDEPVCLRIQLQKFKGFKASRAL
jgi:cytochrome c oxidase subunit 3